MAIDLATLENQTSRAVEEKVLASTALEGGSSSVWR